MSGTDLQYAAIVRLAVEPSWLALPREERRTIARVIEEICARHRDVALDWYDADALGNGFSDFVVCRFADLGRYHFLWEELKDTALFATPYMRIVGVDLGIAQGYEAYEAQLAG
jgi:hypothetical protein